MTYGLYGDNGKEHGNYWDYRDSIRIIGYILGLYGDNGKEHGNYYLGFRGLAWTLQRAVNLLTREIRKSKNGTMWSSQLGAARHRP